MTNQEDTRKCAWCQKPRKSIFSNLCPDCQEKYDKDIEYENSIKDSTQGQALASFESNRMPGKY